MTRFSGVASDAILRNQVRFGPDEREPCKVAAFFCFKNEMKSENGRLRPRFEAGQPHGKRTVRELHRLKDSDREPEKVNDIFTHFQHVPAAVLKPPPDVRSRDLRTFERDRSQDGNRHRINGLNPDCTRGRKQDADDESTFVIVPPLFLFVILDSLCL